MGGGDEDIGCSTSSSRTGPPHFDQDSSNLGAADCFELLYRRSLAHARGARAESGPIISRFIGNKTDKPQESGGAWRTFDVVGIAETLVKVAFQVPTVR
jgi:hypothetical protein